MTRDAAAPVTLHLEVTGRCNLNCIYCYNARFNPAPGEAAACGAAPGQAASGEAPRLGLSELERVLEEAAGLGYRAVVLSGGEPLLHPGFPELARRCAELQLATTLFTNASVPAPAWQAVVEAPGLAAVRVSLDGLSAHDRLRTGSHWATVVDRAGNLKRARPGLRLEVNTMLSRINLQELGPLYGRLRELGAARWNLDLPTPTGRATAAAARSLAVEPGESALGDALARLVEAVLADGEPLRLGIRGVYDSAAEAAGPPAPDALYDAQSHPCQYEAVTVIRPNGDITRCPSHPAVLANLRRAGSLGAALKQSRRHPFARLKLSDCRECAPCRYLRLCGAGCRANARYLKGSDLAPDPVACASLPLAEGRIWPLLPERKRQAYLGLVDPEGSFPSVKMGVENRRRKET